MRAGFLLVLCMALGLPALHAQATWTGASNTTLSNSANWVDGVVPANDGTATPSFGAATNYNVVVNTPYSLAGLTVTSATGSNNYSFSSGQLTFNGGTVTSLTNSASALTFGATTGITLQGTVTFDATGAGGITALGTVSGSGNLEKTGANFLSLSGSNTYTGTTTITAGSLFINADSRLGAAPATPTAGHLVLNGGTLRTSSTVTLSSNRGIAVAASSFINVVSGTTTYGGVITGNSSLSKIGGGTLVLSGANSFSGTAAANGGTLRLDHTDALKYATVSGLGNVTFTTTTANLGALTGAGTKALQDTNSNAVALVVGHNNASTTFGGTLNGAGSLRKVGTGTLTLTGAHSYAGGTTITGGTLSLSGSGTLGSGAVVVNSILDVTDLTAPALAINAGFSGSGTVQLAGKNLSLLGSVAPGAAGAGSLTLSGAGGAVTFGSATSFAYTLGTSQNLLALASGATLDLGSGVINFDDFNFTTGTGFGPGQYTLISGAGNLAGSLGTALTGEVGGYEAVLAMNGNNLVLNVGAIPEPSTYAALAGAAAMGIALWLRRRGRAQG